MKAAIIAFVLTISGQCENPETIGDFVACNPQETEIVVEDEIEPCYGDVCDGLEYAIVDAE
jgi:hypothetical protein